MQKFYFTPRSYLNIEEIYHLSKISWGPKTADQYIEGLYKTFAIIAKNPELGNLRKLRSEPFLIYPSRKHFIVYERISHGIVIITILHQARNIERIIRDFGSDFAEEIKEITGKNYESNGHKH